MPFKSRDQHVYLSLHKPTLTATWEAEERAKERKKRPQLRRAVSIDRETKVRE